MIQTENCERENIKIVIHDVYCRNVENTHIANTLSQIGILVSSAYAHNETLQKGRKIKETSQKG